MNGKKLGRIEKVSFGYGGYQDVQFGLQVTLGDGSWAVGSFNGGWSADIECTEHCKWTEADRDRAFSDTMRYVNGLLKDAKVKSVAELKDIPVEVEFDGNTLKSWRILTEVL